jgi:predicted protein tyrosine phosphatase
VTLREKQAELEIVWELESVGKDAQAELELEMEMEENLDVEWAVSISVVERRFREWSSQQIHEAITKHGLPAFQYDSK